MIWTVSAVVSVAIVVGMWRWAMKDVNRASTEEADQRVANIFWSVVGAVACGWAILIARAALT